MADIDGAVVQVDAGVDSLEGAVGWIALLITSDDVVSHAQGDDLFVVEHVFDDYNRAAAEFVGLFVGVLVFLAVTQFADTHAYGEFLAAVRALEYKRLTSSVAGLVEGNVVLTFGTANTFHSIQKYDDSLQMHHPSLGEILVTVDAPEVVIGVLLGSIVAVDDSGDVVTDKYL